MTTTTAKRCSRGVVGLTVGLVGIAVVLVATIPDNPGGIVVPEIVVAVCAVGYAILGSLIVSGQPRNTIGWGFVGAGVVAGVWASGVQGFDVADHAAGTGLQGMRDRLDAIGGTFAVTSAPGAGTQIEGRIPAQPLAPRGSG